MRLAVLFIAFGNLFRQSLATDNTPSSRLQEYCFRKQRQRSHSRPRIGPTWGCSLGIRLWGDSKRSPFWAAELHSSTRSLEKVRHTFIPTKMEGPDKLQSHIITHNDHGAPSVPATQFGAFGVKAPKPKLQGRIQKQKPKKAKGVTTANTPMESKLLTNLVYVDTSKIWHRPHNTPERLSTPEFEKLKTYCKRGTNQPCTGRPRKASTAAKAKAYSKAMNRMKKVSSSIRQKPKVSASVRQKQGVVAQKKPVGKSKFVAGKKTPITSRIKKASTSVRQKPKGSSSIRQKPKVGSSARQKPGVKAQASTKPVAQKPKPAQGKATFVAGKKAPIASRISKGRK